MGGVGANWKKGGDSLPRLAAVITNGPRSDTVTATIRGCWVGVLELSPWPHPDCAHDERVSQNKWPAGD